VVIFPNCKINLGLQILQKRADGFHDLETVFYPIPLKDVIEAVRSDTFQFTNTGIVIEGNITDNICYKAWKLLANRHAISPVHLHLHKAIPAGAGLGGGSSDGAFTLKLLNQLFQLKLSTETLIDYALELGSDCPFFIINKPAFATGRGEILQSIPLDLSAFTFVLVNPGIHVNTGWAFSQLALANISAEPGSIRQIITQPVTEWKEKLINDFENIVFEKHPEIKQIKATLYDSGAVYASMSGSGSTVFGIFNSSTFPAFKGFENYKVFIF
jgi:4-diphosphocytidyl-2-C-methyl-D-erythritol kinase